MSLLTNLSGRPQSDECSWRYSMHVIFLVKNISSLGIPWNPVVKTPCFHCRGTGSIPGWGTKILCAAQHDQNTKIFKWRMQVNLNKNVLSHPGTLLSFAMFIIWGHFLEGVKEVSWSPGLLAIHFLEESLLPTTLLQQKMFFLYASLKTTTEVE